MSSEVKTADSNGKFSIGPGVGFLIVPWDTGAFFPLEAHVDGSVAAYDVIAEERPIYRDAFSKVEFWGATTGSKWLVYTAKSSADVFGAAVDCQKMEWIARLEMADGITLSVGRNYFNGTGTGVDLITPRLFDVRRYKGVKVAATWESFAPGAGTVKLGVDLYRDNTNLGTMNPTRVMGGTLASIADSVYTDTWIHVSEQIAAASGDNYTHRNDRWPYVAPFVEIGGSSRDTSGLFQVDVFGIR